MPAGTTADGTQIYYKDWGEGQPVVLSHGWPLDADSWDAQMLFLAANGCAASPTTGAAARSALAGGVPIEVFDEIRAGSLADRSQLYRELADGPFFGNNRPGADVSQGTRDASRRGVRRPRR